MIVRERSTRDTGFDGPVCLEQSGDVAWRVVRRFHYRALDGRVVAVPEGASTDGASVPRIVSWLVPRSGRYLPAAVIHDEAYRELIPAKLMTYQQADRMLREAMRRLGVAYLLRSAIFAAVRLAGLGRGRAGRAGWWRDAASVIPVALVALLIVAAPALLVTLALGVWWLLEFALLGPLRLFGRSDHYVNPPRDLSTAD